MAQNIALSVVSTFSHETLVLSHTAAMLGVLRRHTDRYR